MEEENRNDKQESVEPPAEPVDLAKKLIDTLIEERDDQTFAEIVKWMESHLAALNISGDAITSAEDADQNEDASSSCGDVTVDLDINGHQYRSASSMARDAHRRLMYERNIDFIRLLKCGCGSNFMVRLSIEPISPPRSCNLTAVESVGDNLDSAEDAREDEQPINVKQSKDAQVNRISETSTEENTENVNCHDIDDNTDDCTTRPDYDERNATFLARGSKRKAVHPIRINGPTSSTGKEMIETSNIVEEISIAPTSPSSNGNGVKIEVPSLSSCESNGHAAVNHQHKISVSLQSSHDDPARIVPAVLSNASQYSHSTVRPTKAPSDSSPHYFPLPRSPTSALRNSSIVGEPTSGVVFVRSQMSSNGYNAHKSGTGTLSVYNNGNLSDAVNQSAGSQAPSIGPLRTSRLNGDAIKDVPLEYVTPEGKRQYRCPVCMNNYANRSGLNRHYITHSPDDLWKAECHICGKKYSRKDSLKHHIKTQHHPIHSGNLSCRGRCHGGMFSLMNGANEGLLPRSNSCPMDDYIEDHAPTKMPRLQFSTPTDDEIAIDEDNNSCANTLANTVFDKRKSSESTAEANEVANEEDIDQNGSCGGVSATFGASIS